MEAMPSSWKHVMGLYADILVNLVYSQQEAWQGMRAQEVSLATELKQSCQLIAQMLRSQTIDEQNQQLVLPTASEIENNSELEIFVEECRHRIQIFDNVHQHRLEGLEAKRCESCLMLSIDPEDEHGGWDASHDEIFDKVYRRQHTSRPSLLSALRSQLPAQIDATAIDIHEQWYRQMNLIKRQKKDSQLVYERDRLKLIEEVQMLVEVFQRQQAEAMLKASEQEEFNRHRQALHLKLHAMRQEEQLRAIESELDALEQREARQQLLAEERELQRQMREEQKRLVAEYQREKEAQAEEERQQAEQRRLLEAAMRQQQIEANKDRLRDRNQRFLEQREQELHRQEMEYQNQQSRKMELLMSIVKQVPYYDRIQTVESKLDHITASVKAQEYCPIDGDHPSQSRGHMPMHGFADQRIIRDSRLRLATALRAAGLIHSQAARAAIARFHPKPQLAIHGIL
jgi:hypothetical protein